MFDYEVLRFIWWVLVGVLLIGFAVTDGFDMGVGILVRIIGKTDTERRVMINSIAPHWDGNQVWLITAGGALFAAWPMVYAAAFSGFYVAMILVLAALFFRPVGFDYRSSWRAAAGATCGTGASSSAPSCLPWYSAWRSATCCRACRSTWTSTCACSIPATSSNC